MDLLQSENEALRKDKERLDFMNANPFPRIEFNPTLPTYHQSIRDRFPNGFWRHMFGRKDYSNRFYTVRDAIDAAMREKGAK